MQHKQSRRRRNSRVDAGQIFSAVMQDVATTDPEMGKHLYAYAPYYIAFVEGRLQAEGAGTDSESEILDRIQFTGRGISADQKKKVMDCIGTYRWPAEVPATLLGLYLRWREAEGEPDQHHHLLTAAIEMQRSGHTEKDPLDVTGADLCLVVGYPQCYPGALSPQGKAYLRWFQHGWNTKAKKRAQRH